MVWYIVMWVITLAIAFVCGMAIYRNNAKRFKELEEKAKRKGKSLEDYLGL